MDNSDYEREQADFKQLIDDYEQADHQELTELLDALDAADGN